MTNITSIVDSYYNSVTELKINNTINKFYYRINPGSLSKKTESVLSSVNSFMANKNDL